MRELGRLPLTAIPRNTKTLMMFHDMGYFHPYPSSLTDVQRVPATSSLRERIHSGKSSNPLTILLLTLKWLSLRAIKTVFRHHHATYLVPSPFMKSFVETHREKE